MDTVFALILNYVSYPETLRYVENLKAQKGIKLSVLIVDNYSPNDAFTRLKKVFENDPLVEVIQSEYNGGYAYGNNFGLQYLKDRPFDYLLISNNDILLDDDLLLCELVNAYKKIDRAGFIAPRMLVGGKEDQKHQAWKLPRVRDTIFSSLRLLYRLASLLNLTNRYRFDPEDRQLRPVDCLSGSFFLGAKTLFYDIGRFDEHTFLYGEESILGQKIRRKGLQNYLLRSRYFHHQSGKTARNLYSLFRLQRFWLESMLYYHRRYHKIGVLEKALLYFLLGFWVLETFVVNRILRLTQNFTSSI